MYYINFGKIGPYKITRPKWEEAISQTRHSDSNPFQSKLMQTKLPWSMSTT